MKIRTQFILTLSLFGLILVVMVSSLIFTNQQVDRLLQQEEVARRIERRASELNYLSGDYLMYGESQQRLRWESSFASFSEDVSKLKPVNSEQQTIVAHIKADQARLLAVFRNVVSTLEESDQSPGAAPDQAFTQVSWSRIEVQNQNIAFEASQLSQQLREEAEQLRRWDIVLIFALVGIFGAYLLTNYYLIDRRTLRSIAQLHAGTEIIGSGNLDFTIAVKRADEIGELSQAFNRMTDNLKEVTASKADLEREIVERNRVEEALLRTNERLQEQAEELDVQAEELRVQTEELAAANQQLRESEHRYSTVFDTSPFAMSLTKMPEGILVGVNNAFLKLFEFTQEDVIGKSSVDLGIADQGLRDQITAEMSAHDSVQNLEVTGISKTGTRRILSLNMNKVHVDGGEHILTTVRDVTERRRAEEALRQVNEKLQAQAMELASQAEALYRQKDDLVAANEQLRLSEEIANQRFMEIQTANKELQSARLAALNLMEDALVAQEKVKEINTRLRESEQRLNRAQEIAHLGSWELDPVNDRLTWSDEVYRIFGLQPQEFAATYEAFLEAVHPDDRPAVDDAYSGSVRDGRDTYEIEHRVIRRSTGEIRIVHEKCEHFRDEAGEIIRSVGMVHDITERKKAEDALRESEEKFRRAFADAAIAFAMTKPDGRILDANPAYCFLTDYTLEELHETDFQNLIHPDDRSENMKMIDQMLAGEIADFVVENRYLRKDGKNVWVRKSVSLVRSADGSPQWIIALVEDIDERKRAEEALRLAHEQLEIRVRERTEELAAANRVLSEEIAERKEIERQLRIQTAAMDAAANGIIITDPNGVILWANPAITQISGYENRELIGRSTHIFNSGRHDNDFYQRMWKTILAGNVWHGETTNRRKDGGLYVEEQTITPVQNEDGELSHFIAIKQDVTERKLIYSQLEDSNRDLRQLTAAERQQRFLAEGLVEASVVLNMSLELHAVLDRIFEQTRRTIPYLVADVILIQDGVANVVQRWGEDRPELRTIPQNEDLKLVDFPIWEEILATKSALMIPDTTLDDQWKSYFGMAWIRSYIGAPLIYGDRVIGIINLGSDEANAFHPDMVKTLAAFAAPAAVAIQNARLYEDEQQNRKVAEILSAASVALSQTLDIETVLETILDYIQSIMKLDVALVLLSEGDERYRVRSVRAGEGLALPNTLQDQIIDILNEPIVGPYFTKNESTFIPDSCEISNWNPRVELAGLRCWLGIPLESMGKSLGMIVIGHGTPNSFTKYQIGLVEAVVRQAVVALQNAWLFEQVRSGRERLQQLSRHLVEVQENERKYIARELHDETSQSLTSLKMGLQVIEQKAAGHAQILKQVKNLKHLADETLESLHHLAVNLRPASLDHLGLVEALTGLIESTRQRSGLIAHFKTMGTIQAAALTEEIEASIYRIVQESLTNVVRHAQASYVDVILDWQDEKIVIIIEDDGVGLDLGKARAAGHLGLVGMQERAEMLGGKLVVDSTPQSGTTLVVEIPYANTNTYSR